MALLTNERRILDNELSLPVKTEKTLNQQPKLWQILAAFLPIIIGITSWLWNLSTKVEKQEIRINIMEANYTEFKQDMKEVKQGVQSILINMERKEDRKNK